MFKRKVPISIAGIGAGIVRYSRVDEKRPCDVAIVLGAGTFNGEISAVYRERINHGIWLWENGYADFLIFTGGYGYRNIWDLILSENQIPEQIEFYEREKNHESI